MNRMRRLTNLWSWLPAFRVVAETEHLPTAAKTLAVSPSALSRSVRLLEEAVGQPLFNRLPRRLQLNPAGQELLESIRTAMRRLDDGLHTIGGATLIGELRIATTASTAALLVVPAMEAVRSQNPGLIPELTAMSSALAFELLLQGRLDIALVEERAAPPRDCVGERLLEVTYGVYCGERHPLFGARKVSDEEVLEHPFVGPPDGVDDGWPPQLARTVGFRVWSYHLAVELCREGRYLATLPDRCVEAMPKNRGKLKRLPVSIESKSEIFAVYRRPMGVRDRVQVALEALRAMAG
ncbi:MAG: LysR family transcriptional regulator [Myxococcales bacterium]|nr:LysR family transcriptional regulator [Myxococcales bacterium]